MKLLWASLNSAVFMAAVAGYFIGYKITHIPRQLEATLLFAAAIAYPVIRNPLFGFYLFFGVSPFITYLRRLYYLVYDRPSIDPLIMAGDIIILFVFVGLFFTFRNRPPRDPQTKFPSRMVLIYLVFITLRTFLFQTLPITEAVARYKYYGPAVLFFFLGIHFADRFRLIVVLCVMTCAIGVAAALYGIKQLYLGYSEAEKLWFSSIDFVTLTIKGVVRPFSFFQAPVILCDYLQLALISLILLWQWERRLFSLLLPPTATLYAFAILITSVRSSWIGLITTPVFYCLFVGVRGWFKRAAVIALMVGVLIGYELFSGENDQTDRRPTSTTVSSKQKSSSLLLPFPYFDLLVMERVAGVTNPFEEHSMRSRINLWRYLIVLARDPELAWMGRGLGAMRVDSLYFTYFAEFGYPGMFFIIFIVVFFICRGLSVIDAGGDRRIIALAKAITVMNLVFALVNITGTHIHTFPGDVYFWFFNGVLVNIGALQRELLASDRDTAPAGARR